MRNLLHPKWVVFIQVLPLVVLSFLLWSKWDIVHSQLKEENIIAWQKLSLMLLGLILFSTISAVVVYKRKGGMGYIYALVSLLAHITWLYIFEDYQRLLAPFSIPNWIINDDEFMAMVLTFFMPVLIFNLLIAVVHLTPTEKNHKAWISFVVAVSIPLLIYFFVQVLSPLLKDLNHPAWEHIAVILMVILLVLFFFFLIRAVYIIANKKSAVFKKYELLWKVPIALFFPILGLLLNNGVGAFKLLGENVLGDFNHPLFYALALLNGALICIPNPMNAALRLTLFAGRSIMLVFTFYFLLVLMPYLPLSLICIIVFGLGFLMLTPLALFVVHISDLTRDYKSLKEQFNSRILNMIMITSMMVLPITILINYWLDRQALHGALEYIDRPHYGETYEIDADKLSNTIATIEQNKRSRWSIGHNSQQPFLSSFYNWMVLDNLTLSERNLNRINQVFYGEKETSTNRNQNIQNEILITASQIDSDYDTETKTWRTWLNLEMTNTNHAASALEFATQFKLPAGCYISDYYLDINGRREKGILAEKKAATWIYSETVRVRRDPGILFYQDGNNINFRVFPFASDEVRKTGIEFLHKEPVVIGFEGQEFQLGNDSATFLNEPVSEDQMVYLPAAAKNKLPLIHRKPYYYFMVDCSAGNEVFTEEFIKRIDKLMEKNLISPENAKICFTNTYTHEVDFNNVWKDQLTQQKFEGGYFLDRAIRQRLITDFNKKEKNYPVLITLTDSLENAVLSDNYKDIEFTFPDCENLFELTSDGNLLPHSLMKLTRHPRSESYTTEFKKSVRVYPDEAHPTAYLKDDGEAEIIYSGNYSALKPANGALKSWLSGLTIHSNHISQLLCPESAQEKWLDEVRDGFRTGIMSPATSYIALENEMQKAVLKKKQDEILNGNKSLDGGEDLRRMSEPEVYWILLALGSLLIWKDWRRRVL
jgi:Vault protein inter-alpha-trypsin domain